MKPPLKADRVMVHDVRPRRSPEPTCTEAPISRLDGLSIAVIDNGKGRPQFGNFRILFDTIEARLGESAVNATRQEFDLLQMDQREIDDCAQKLGSLDGAVIGIADTGVSAPTALLAAALQDLGVRTVILGQGVGVRTVETMLRQLGHRIPIVELRSWRLTGEFGVRDDADRLWQDIEIGIKMAPMRRAASQIDETDAIIELRGPDITADFTEMMASQGYGDGFPLIAPTKDRVAKMMSAMGISPSETIWDPIGSRSQPVTGLEVAALAVMAGCQTRSARVVLEALRCMQDPEFRLFQGAITTHPAGTLILVSGPIAYGVGMATSFGSLGPSSAANASIGRSIALSHAFLLGMKPGDGDISSQGSPAEFTYCTAENFADSPWDSYAEGVFGPGASSVTVLKCEGPHNVLDNVSTTPESLLRSIADTASALGGNNLYVHGAQTVVFLNPEHARLLYHSGWNKPDVQSFLFNTARRPREDLIGRGIAPNWDPAVSANVPIARKPEDIIVVVVGAPGPQSQVAIPWGYSTGITRQIEPAIAC